MGNILKIISLIFISIFLVSCDNSTTEVKSTTFNISGKITDQDGNLLDDVNVYLVYHLKDIPLKKVSKITTGDTLYQNFPNPFCDSTSIRFESYRNVRYEIKFIDYNSLNSAIILQGSSAPGVVDTSLIGFNDYPNGMYKLSIRYIVNFTTGYGSEINVFINRTQSNQLALAQPNFKSLNGQFYTNLSALPFQKIIRYTGGTEPTEVSDKQISDLVTFIMMKDGYQTLQVDKYIDRYNQNELNFVMKKK